MEELRELLQKIKDIEITYDYEDTYYELYNTCREFQDNIDEDFDFEDLFDEIISIDIAEQIAEQEFASGGLVRMYYFIGNCNLGNADIVKINAYGNLEDIHKEDLELLKENIIEKIEDFLEE